MNKNRSLTLVALLVLPLAIVLACDSTNPVAPDGVTLTISASKTQIAISGETTEISVTGFRPDGNRLFPGTQITFSTNLGTISPAVDEIGNDGFAQATLVGTGQQGMATVSVGTAGSSGGGGMGGGGATSGSIDVTIGDDDTSRPQLTITVSPAELDINEDAEVIVDIRNADGSPFTGTGEVTLTTTLGCFGAGNANCPKEIRREVDGRSRIVAPFNSLSEAGTATVRGLLGSAEAETMVAIDVERPQLLVTVTPNDIAVGANATVTVLARDVNGTPLGQGNRVQLFTTLGGFPTEASRTITTASNGRATATYNAGERAGTATITAVLGTSDPITTNVTIRDVVGSFELDAPGSINRPGDAGVTLTLTGRVTNSLGQPINNVTVVFSSSINGEFTLPNGTASNGNVTTNTSGVAEVQLTLTNVNTDGQDFFDVTASPIAETSTGDPISVTRRININ